MLRNEKELIARSDTTPEIGAVDPGETMTGEARTMSHAVTLVTDDLNRVRAQCRCAWRSPWITPDQHSQPRKTVAERVAGRHLHETAR